MWDSPLSVWQNQLSSYSRALESRQTHEKKPDLVDLDRFLWQELPEALPRRDPQYITSDEYSHIVRWKLKRGKWRPRLQKFADDTPPDEIVKASQASFDSLRNGQLKEALAHLVALKGCGPATASAVLAAADENLPFMSDELLLETQGQQKKYTLPAYLELIRTVQAKATQLTNADKDHAWTARDIEHAVFASRHQAPDGPRPAVSSATKVKASKARAAPELETPRSRKRPRTTIQREDQPPTSTARLEDREVNNDEKTPEVIARPTQRKVDGVASETAGDERPLRRSSRRKFSSSNS